MCLLFCFVLFWILCCVVCEKNENKKLLITKKNKSAGFRAGFLSSGLTRACLNAVGNVPV